MHIVVSVVVANTTLTYISNCINNIGPTIHIKCTIIQMLL